MSTSKGRVQLFFVCIFLVVALLVLQRDPADAELSSHSGTVKIINIDKDNEDLHIDKKEHYILIKSAEVEFIDKILKSVFK